MKPCRNVIHISDTLMEDFDVFSSNCPLLYGKRSSDWLEALAILASGAIVEPNE